VILELAPLTKRSPGRSETPIAREAEIVSQEVIDREVVSFAINRSSDSPPGCAKSGGGSLPLTQR